MHNMAASQCQSSTLWSTPGPQRKSSAGKLRWKMFCWVWTVAATEQEENKLSMNAINTTSNFTQLITRVYNSKCLPDCKPKFQCHTYTKTHVLAACEIKQIGLSTTNYPRIRTPNVQNYIIRFLSNTQNTHR